MSSCFIKVVALDVYGTILAYDDYDCSFPPRKGLEDFLDQCDEKKVKVVTSSDSFIQNVKNDLIIAFKLAAEKIADGELSSRMKKRLNIGRFDDFFQLDQGVKDFSVIIGHYGINPRELLVVGDNIDRDVQGAIVSGANVIYCPPYGVNEGGKWDFTKIELDCIKS